MLAEPDAANFLVVGADNNDCTDAPITEDRSDLGERSDTIMVWRANPDTNQLAVLSFPRDLYVEYPSGRKDRINAAFVRERPDAARKRSSTSTSASRSTTGSRSTSARSGSSSTRSAGSTSRSSSRPATSPTRDGPPLFLVEQTGCVNLNGEVALAYVRSRHYQYEDPPGSGNWISDPTSDFGRIGRQQDFLRRVLAKVVDQGLYDPSVASALITTNRNYLVTDTDLTVRRMLEFASALRNFDADQVRSYRIESSSQTIQGAEVEIPRIKNDTMRGVLAVFRGEATLAEAPEQELDVVTTSVATTGSVPTDDERPTTSTSTDDERSAKRRRLGFERRCSGRRPPCPSSTSPRTPAASSPTARSAAADAGQRRSSTAASAATTDDGPSYVAHAAPTASASRRASVSSPAGASTTRWSIAAAAAITSPGSVARQSESRTVTERDAGAPRS